MSDTKTVKDPLTSFTARIVSAYVVGQRLPLDQLPALIGQVHTALYALGNAPEPEQSNEKPVPPVSIRKSVHNDYLICLEDGKKFQTLKRHLKVHYDLSPDEYREKWGLPKDYPMTAPGYGMRRAELALSIGLGQSRKSKQSFEQASVGPNDPVEKKLAKSSPKKRNTTP